VLQGHMMSNETYISVNGKQKEKIIWKLVLTILWKMIEKCSY